MTKNTGHGNDTPLNGCVRQALEKYFKDLEGHSTGNLYQLILEEVERPMLDTVMNFAEGNQTRASQLLGISRGTLRKKLKQYGLDD